MRRLAVAFTRAVLVLAGLSTARAEDLVETKLEYSPDQHFSLELKLWNGQAGPWYQLAMARGSRQIWESKIGPEEEPRYAKASWSPDSSAALIAINFKSSEDWILLRLRRGQVFTTRFSGDKFVDDKMLNTLPFRQEIASSAPVARVPWKTVHWLPHRRCTMDYIFHGIGYEGTAHLLIDYHREAPRLKILDIVPKVDPALWDED